MKYLLMTAVSIVALSPAFAGESTIKVPDSFHATMQQTQAAFERCIGATVAYTHTDQCAAVANVLSQLVALAPPPPVSPAPTPSPTPTPTP
jgi:hypothetical protein